MQGWGQLAPRRASDADTLDVHPCPTALHLDICFAHRSQDTEAMFNALNRFISRLDGDAPQQQRQQEQGSFGFQVLRNTNLELTIEPWFDFIVGINGRPIV